MDTNQNATKSSVQLLTRFDALPARQKQLFGKLCLAHAVNVDQLRQSIPGLPSDPIVSIMESLMCSVEPKS